MSDNVENVIKYLIECHRKGDAVYHGEELVAPKIKSLRDVPPRVLVLEEGASVFDVVNCHVAQTGKSIDKLDILCRFLLLALFESDPFPVGKELAYIYGRLKRMEDAKTIVGFSEKISKLEVAPERSNQLQVEIREDLFGQRIVYLDSQEYTADNLPTVELATGGAFCKFLESRFMLALFKSIISADESCDLAQREDLNACLQLLSGQSLHEFMSRMVGKSPQSFVETLMEELSSFKKPTSKVEDQVQVFVHEIRRRFIGDFEIDDVKIGELYLLPSKIDSDTLAALYGQAIGIRIFGSSFSKGLVALQSRLKLIAPSRDLHCCVEKVSIKEFVESFNNLFVTKVGDNEKWIGLIGFPYLSR